MSQKVYKFKYSKSLLGLESLTVFIEFGLSAYLYFEKENKFLAIVFMIVGVSNSIYYYTRLRNNKTQLTINSTGILLKKRFIPWNDIENILIDRVDTGNVSGDFLTVFTKKGKDCSLEISELNVTPKKLKEIISQFNF